ncbi:hypothetical protein M3484_18800 [Pseudomonas sp. GX19020]|uniref:hypothetical protein n=1 Tax=Pseudomonas sp. GX19020 TaxID=2942277 RepID=UPI002019E9A7|nr:hypothetical protein [Pseudomonas sp. GX19020]MCL4068618.1 hypothetical protein [Pseudomonas sp. GX19020]
MSGHRHNDRLGSGPVVHQDMPGHIFHRHAFRAGLSAQTEALDMCDGFEDLAIEPLGKGRFQFVLSSFLTFSGLGSGTEEGSKRLRVDASHLKDRFLGLVVDAVPQDADLVRGEFGRVLQCPGRQLFIRPEATAARLVSRCHRISHSNRHGNRL